MTFNRLDGFGRQPGQVLVAAHDHLADHPGQAHFLAVLGAVDSGDAVGMQLADFRRHDDAAAAAKHLDMLAAAGLEQVDHVFEVLDMPALVRADGDALRVFLQGGRDHFIDAAVVTEVDHFGAHALQNAPHDVDRRIMAVEQRSRRHKAHLVCGAVVGQGLVFGGQIGHGILSRKKRLTPSGRKAGRTVSGQQRPNPMQALTLT